MFRILILLFLMGCGKDHAPSKETHVLGFYVKGLTSDTINPLTDNYIKACRTINGIKTNECKRVCIGDVIPQVKRYSVWISGINQDHSCSYYILETGVKSKFWLYKDYGNCSEAIVVNAGLYSFIDDNLYLMDSQSFIKTQYHLYKANPARFLQIENRTEYLQWNSCLKMDEVLKALANKKW